MNPILVLPYHQGDKARAARLLRWLLQLDFTRDSAGRDVDLLVVHSRNTDTRGILHLARLVAGGSVEVFVPHDENEAGWWVSANHLWWRTVEHVCGKLGRPFFWLESDALPLRASWWREIVEEWRAAPDLPLMSLSGVPHPLRIVYLHGCGVYPADTHAMKFEIGGYAFDAQVMAQYGSRLVPARTLGRNLVPGFDLDRLDPEVVIAHPIKSTQIVEALCARELGAMPDRPEPRNEMLGHQSRRRFARDAEMARAALCADEH